MQKILAVVFVLIFFIPFVFAEETLEDTTPERSFVLYESLFLNYQASTRLHLERQTPKAKLSEFALTFHLLPDPSDQQKLLSQHVLTTPFISPSYKEDTLQLLWKNPQSEMLTFDYDVSLAVTQSFPKITRKVSFPPSVFEEVQPYLAPTSFIEITPEITLQAREIISDETDMYVASFLLASWVKENVRYDLTTLTAEAVQTSSWVFQERRGVCDELTNLFIAMARSVGIPARFVTGTVYSGLLPGWGNHGWAEVYFQGYGWVPFDVTYGQYGWIDPSHVKLADGFDSASPSVEYQWRSTDVEMLVEELQLSTKLVSKGDLLQPLVSLKVEPLTTQAKMGSSVVVQVHVTNPQPFYVSTTLLITKAPGILGVTQQEILLKPFEKRTYYFITQTPSNLLEQFVYSAPFEVETSFGAKASSQVSYAAEFPFYSLEQAQQEVMQLEQRTQKLPLKDVNLDCSLNKKDYFSYDPILVACKVMYQGEGTLRDVFLCLDFDCKTFSFDANHRQEQVVFTTENKEFIKILAETSLALTSFDLDVDLIKVPDLFVTDLQPKTLGYKEEGVLSLGLNSYNPAYNVTVDIFNVARLRFSQLQGNVPLELEVTGKDLLGGVSLSMEYFDSKGNLYKKNKVYPFKVTKRLWYTYLYFWTY